MSTQQVVDRTSGEILGEANFFTIPPGQFDLLVHIPLLVPPRFVCGGTAPPTAWARFGKHLGMTHVVIATLKPNLWEDESK
jgi:hypothetical protein